MSPVPTVSLPDRVQYKKHRRPHVVLLAAVSTFLLAACDDGGSADPSPVDEHEGEAPVVEGGVSEVHLDSTALALSGVVVALPESVGAGGLPVTGNITYDQNRVSHIGPKTQGRVVELTVEVGSRVDRGQVLAHLESPEVGATRAELHEAEALLEIAQENYEREGRLEAQGISSRRELLDAEAELRRVQARLASAQERLRVLGADVHDEGGHFDVPSPFDGVVVERHAGRGEVVGPTDQLFTVADLSRLWIELDIYERNLNRVERDQPVTVTTTAWPDRVFPGRIVYIADIVDSQRRTVRARVELENTDGALKPGMFATALIEMADGARVIALPRDAVQTVDEQQIVWVLGEEAGEFIVRPVTLGPELPGGLVEILSGLAADEPVVVVGAFTLKSELAKGDFGGHGH
ncbi:efflux RND transporter periplasmic adaptor subunit [Gaopeijia maritima]|uniref:efflux RND transporter periplasmic adaptor subunit n=1 Tax=Gaopeijia maritima TaxID=3119007 RepID=UPI003245290E